MRFIFCILYLTISLSAAAQCTEIPTITTTGGNCFGTASLYLNSVDSPSQVTWYRNNIAVITYYAPSSTITTLAADSLPGPGVYKAAVTTFNGCNYTTGDLNIYPTGAFSAAIDYGNYFKASCQDYPATFISSAEQEILSSAFQWLKNGTPINGRTDSFFTSNNLVNDDTISCRIITFS